MRDFWIPSPTIRSLYWMARAISGGILTFCVLLLLTLSALRAGAVSKPGIPFRERIQLGARELLLLSWAIVPFVSGYVLSIAAKPILYDRYLIGSLPPFLLLAARGLSLLRSDPRLQAGAVAALAICGGPAAYGSITSYNREDMRALIEPFSADFRNTDAVVLSSPGVLNTFHYYYREPVPLEFVMWNARSDPFDGPDVSREWVFVRGGIETITAPVLERIEERYQRQQAFHAYDFDLYLYVRRPGQAAEPEGRD